jgi:L-methionine (R)-S-oxide reductase
MRSSATIVSLRKDLELFSLRARVATEFMTGVAKLLHQRMLKYNWVGYYMLEEIPGETPVLVLGPFEGAMTPHARIQLNQGICGAAASTGKTVIVDDVSKDPRYLPCSLETKSEIVAPVFIHGRVAGELDIDSHFPAAFGNEDRLLVEYCAALVGKHLEKSLA